MTNKHTALLKEAFIAAIINFGFTKDKYGNFQYTRNIGDVSRVYRIKMNSTSFRFEFKNTLNEWQNCNGGQYTYYYSKLGYGYYKLGNWVMIDILQTEQ